MKEIEVSIICGKFEVSLKELRKYKNGKLMYDIACCNPDDCFTKEAYMEMLEFIANKIEEDK